MYVYETVIFTAIYFIELKWRLLKNMIYSSFGRDLFTFLKDTGNIDVYNTNLIYYKHVWKCYTPNRLNVTILILVKYTTAFRALLKYNLIYFICTGFNMSPHSLWQHWKLAVHKTVHTARPQTPNSQMSLGG